MPAAPLPTSVDGSELGLHAVFSEFPISLHNDSTPLPPPVSTPASYTAVIDEAALGAIPPALSVHKHSMVRQMDSGLQAPSPMSHSASPVAEINRGQIPAVPAAPPLVPSPSPTALRLAVTEPPLLASLSPPWIIVSIDRILLHLPSHDQPPPGENRTHLGAPRLLRLRPGPPSTRFLLRRSNTTIDAAAPAPPLLRTLLPETPRRVSTRAVFPETR